jgi:hypothetical protein
MSTWFAHSHPNLPEERWHTLRDHLTSVGAQAANSAGKFKAAEMEMSRSQSVAPRPVPSR